MSNTSQKNNFPLLRRSPGLAEIDAILNLFPIAMFLVEVQNHRVLAANAHAIELTAYTRVEIVEMDLRSLLVDLDSLAKWGKNGEEAVPRLLTLKCRNKSEDGVRVTLNELPPQGKWAILSMEPASLVLQQVAEQQRQEKIRESMQTIIQALLQNDQQSSLDLILKAGSELTGASLLSVYLHELDHNGQDLQLSQDARFGTADIFPPQLPAQDLAHLRKPHLWTPGKRSLSSLHRAVRSAGLGYVGTAPLGQPKALIGLVAFAGEQIASPEQILPLIQALADVITALIQHYSQLANLKYELERQLQENEIYLTIGNTVHEGVIVLNPDLTIRRLNPSAELTLGYSSRNVQGQPVENILIGTDSLTPALRLAQGGVPTLNQSSIRFYRRSGKAFLAQASVFPVEAENELQGIIILIQDLSEQEQIQTQAQQLEQQALLGEVTAIFAHEVRNPINNISTGLQLMAFNLPQEDPNQEVISRLQQDCDRLEELMKSVLSFSRPTEYEMEAIDLGALTSHLLDRHRPKMTSQNVQHHLQVQAALPLIEGNPRALEQVFTNLINNAIQAMSKNGGTLALKVQTVRSSGGRQSVEVSVADNGPGIPKDLQDRVFQPFVTTKQHGTGLGLAITKRIVTAHKGTIRLTSFPGGTVFYVQFPAVALPPENT